MSFKKKPESVFDLELGDRAATSQKRYHRILTALFMVVGLVFSMSVVSTPAASAITMPGCLGPGHKHIMSHGVNDHIMYQSSETSIPQAAFGRFVWMESYNYCPNGPLPGKLKFNSARACITWDHSGLHTDPHGILYQGLEWHFFIRSDTGWNWNPHWFMAGRSHTQQCTNWHKAPESHRQYVFLHDWPRMHGYCKARIHFGKILDLPGTGMTRTWEVRPSIDLKVS